MARLPVLLAFVVVVPALAGCFGGERERGGEPEPEPPTALFENGLLVQSFGDHGGRPHAVAKAAAGALSELTVQTAGALSFPDDVLVYREGRFVRGDAVKALANESVLFLPPPGRTNVTVDAAGTLLLVETPMQVSAEFASGASALYLAEVQRDHFPRRSPGLPNYVAAQAYFAAWFERHGFEVSVEPVLNEATAAGCVPTPFLGPHCPNSIVNVVAYRRGTLVPERILGFGAHYDMVRQTRDAALDDTSGTVEVLELARVFANVSTEHSLLLGLWGGEESGLLGSQAWVRAHPDKTALMSTYVNLDVSALSWPAPLQNPRPDPVASSAGPDGPLADRVNAGVARAWGMAGFPEDMIRYRQVAQGQRSGGVDAQSDHTAFIAQGVPSTFLFTTNVSGALRLIHGPQDTLANMTLFALTGFLPTDADAAKMTAEEWAQGREALARSLGTYLWTSFYFVMQAELGSYDPRVA